MTTLFPFLNTNLQKIIIYNNIETKLNVKNIQIINEKKLSYQKQKIIINSQTQTLFIHDIYFPQNLDKNYPNLFFHIADIKKKYNYSNNDLLHLENVHTIILEYTDYKFILNVN